MKRDLLFICALGSIVLPENETLAKPSTKEINKPNVILIMADDLGWGDVGFNGSRIVKTPNLDKIASQGVQFNRFYAACAVSSPTRASVLTGRNPFRTGVFDANFGILRPEEFTIPDMLKTLGYTSGHFGKWHLGTLTASETDANRGKKGNFKEYNPPKLHGFDVAFVSESKVPTWDPMKLPVDFGDGSLRDGWDYIKKNQKYEFYGTHYWDIDGNIVSKNLDGDDSRVIMDRVVPFVEKNARTKKPFLAVVWFHAPHLPVVAGPKYAAMYYGHTSFEKNYWGCITAMDEQVGRLMAVLEKEGLSKNTIICFCSDNGSENNTPGDTGGYKARKRSLHEGGVRVPSFIYYPKLIKKPFKTDFPAVTSDYLPTIASLVGFDMKKIPYQIDGVDLSPVLEHKNMIRKKPIVSCYLNQISLNGVEYKVYYNLGKYEFYNIVKDPYELNPISEDSKLKELRNVMNGVMKDYKDSFEGEEYGTKSYDRMGDDFRDPKTYVGPNRKKR